MYNHISNTISGTLLIKTWFIIVNSGCRVHKVKYENMHNPVFLW
ncbi:MAG: hypothetical protein E3K29_11025 [Candidatus Brocadia sp.]|nr:hypothetical protein [Candidatus Brocadia sp.]